MRINSDVQLVEELSKIANEYGIVTSISGTEFAYIVTYLRFRGLMDVTMVDGKEKESLNTSRVNDFLKPYGLYIDFQGKDTDRTMYEYLDRFGAIEDGKFMYNRVFVPNENRRKASGDMEVYGSIAMRKKLQRVAKLRGFDVRSYVTQVLGLELDFEDRTNVKNGKTADGVKQQIIDYIEDKMKDGEKLSHTDRVVIRGKLMYHDIAKTDESLSTISDILLNDIGADRIDPIKVRQEVGDIYERIVKDILMVWPEGIISSAGGKMQQKVYSQMYGYYRNTPHSKGETFNAFWSSIFNRDERLSRYTFRGTKNTDYLIAKEAELIRRAIEDSPARYVDENGVVHMQGLFDKDRKNYSLLRRRALDAGLTLADYLLKEYGIVLDAAKKKHTPKLNSSIIQDSRDYVKKAEGSDKDGM